MDECRKFDAILRPFEVPESVWQENLYLDWLGCLRTLSRPTTAVHYPEVMRTQAWAMKLTNTQLASWTTLRHDTILYVKQSYPKQSDCSYPAGYVEPLPEFWARMEQMSRRAVKTVAQLPGYQSQRRPTARHDGNFVRELGSCAPLGHPTPSQRRRRSRCFDSTRGYCGQRKNSRGGQH